MYKTLSATRNVSSKALEIPEPTSCITKGYRYDTLSGSDSVLNIGMSELLDSDVNENSGTARNPLSGNCFYDEPLDGDSIDDPRSSQLGCDPLNIRGVAREHPHSEGGCNST